MSLCKKGKYFLSFISMIANIIKIVIKTVLSFLCMCLKPLLYADNTELIVLIIKLIR